ncbi:ArnT family glycosyltransferase [Pseudonocardia hispaniensis]|uniref:ArnT family glycosyltransferase n=1 Tax=Pseudonocardia hispaniensis TaxID=904933 RepID=A0ABW1IZE6_9PSEU
MADPDYRRRVHTEWLVILGGALLCGVTMLWNITASPDTQYDEVVYTRAAQQVAQGWHLTWTNSPMFVHPPLSFLAQAAWLRLLGLGSAPLADAIIAARILTAGVTVFAVLLLGLIAAYLAPAAGRRRGLILVGIVVALAATDPVLLRYGRLALIEPLALVAALLTLCLAIWLRSERALLYVPVVGLASGLTLLTKEVTVFLLFTPVLHAVLGREWRRAAIVLGGFLWGLGLWLLFPLWSVALGLTSDFVDIKFATVQRLLGLLQITGWNRPGVSFLSAIGEQFGQYASSYVVLATGAIALAWLLTRAVSGASRWLLAWLLTSYAFGAYTVLLGTLNEQFFVYILPAAIVGSVLAADAALARLAAGRGRTSSRIPRALAGVMAIGVLTVAVLGSSLGGWVRLYASDNNGVFALADDVRSRFPACAALAVTGDPDKYSYLMPGHPVAAFATGEGAQSHGLHLFVISDKDVAAGYGNATTELTRWVRARGTLLATFTSATYHGLQLWQTPLDPYDPLADIEPVPGGVFVGTDTTRCGGFPVLDGPRGAFSTAWQTLGGKAVLGAPMSRSWTAAGTSYQVFTGAVLSLDATGRASALPIVADLATADPAGYRAAGLPPVGGGRGLTDPAIAAAYRQEPMRALLGAPVGPVTPMPDGTVRQAFAGGVLERAADSDRVRLAPLGRLALQAGLARPDREAVDPVAAPPLPSDLGPPQPTTVQPFVTALLAGLALYTGLPVVLIELIRLGHRRTDRRGPS